MVKMIEKTKGIMPFALVALLVSLGVMAGMVIAPVRAQSTYATIGYVDVQAALSAHPQFESVTAQMEQIKDTRMAELTGYENIDALTEEQRQQLIDDFYRIQDEIEAEQRQLTEPLIQDVIDATTQIGEESGIEVILESGAVVWGGLNLTPLIEERLQMTQ